MNEPKDKVDLIRESDRGAVIVGAAILDDDVTQLLRAVFEVNKISNKQMDKMFDLSGPLSSFGSKTLMAYGFGLISKPVFEDLNRIRSLRNDFAHSSVTVDFLSDDIVESVMSLHCVKEAKEGFKAQRYSVSKGEVTNEWQLQGKGYVKHTKALFAIGLQHLRIHLLHQRQAAVMKAYLLRESNNSLEGDASKPRASG